MKKTILTSVLLLLVVHAIVSQTDFNKSNDYWTIDVNFGATRLIKDQPAYSLLQENINVGLDVGASYTFNNNIFIATGVTFSTLKITGLWENPLNYFSGNLDVGYRFENNRVVTPYLAIGGSFINAPNTILDSENSYSLNFTGGLIFWLKDSNYGLVIQNTYKSVSSDYMVSHNRITLGVKYML